MITKFVLFDPSDETAAYAYAAACSVEFEAIVNDGPQYWGLNTEGLPVTFLPQDRNDNWVVPYFGAPAAYAGNPLVETPALEALRSVALEIVDTPDWPE